jgi:hypothetical protein
MLTAAAARSLPDSLSFAANTITSSAELIRSGYTRAAVRAQLDARRWQQIERAVVLHNGQLHRDEQQQVALVNCGPRAVLTAFTAAERRGLSGWERDRIDVLVPAGARVLRPGGIDLRVHYTGSWVQPTTERWQAVQRIAPALVRAASTFTRARAGCGILAAGVQQRLVRAHELESVLHSSPRTRHHAVLLHAVRDIAQGSQALSEIDFARLCRRFALPTPTRQAVRIEPSGRRRYLDAEWLRGDGSRVAVEVDGALHLTPRRWWDDEFRHNEIVISGTALLRFPSVVLRTEAEIVPDQLRRLLRL